MRSRRDAEVYAGGGGYVPPPAYLGAEAGDPAGWQDAELGQIFRNMRLAMKVSRETIARRLATSTACVDNFEAGAVAALPHAKETDRIVRGYCELLRLDPEPILWRIRSHLEALAEGARAAATMPLPAAIVPTSSGRSVRQTSHGAKTAASSKSERSTNRSPSPFRRRTRALFALSAPIALLAALVYVAHAAPRPVYRFIALLPAPAGPAVRASLDYLVLLTAPRREGLWWIEVSDPRLRKADKLKTTR